MQCYRVCSYCKQEKDTMLRCGACRGAFYCDKTCQAAAWPGHKTRCAQKAAIALFARKHLEKQPTTFKLLALCTNLYSGRLIKAFHCATMNISLTLNVHCSTVVFMKAMPFE